MPMLIRGLHSATRVTYCTAMSRPLQGRVPAGSLHCYCCQVMLISRFSCTNMHCRRHSHRTPDTAAGAVYVAIQGYIPARNTDADAEASMCLVRTAVSLIEEADQHFSRLATVTAVVAASWPQVFARRHFARYLAAQAAVRAVQGQAEATWAGSCCEDPAPRAPGERGEPEGEHAQPPGPVTGAGGAARACCARPQLPAVAPGRLGATGRCLGREGVVGLQRAVDVTDSSTSE